MDVTDLSEKLLKKELSRKEFIKLAGLSLFCTTFADPVKEIIKATVLRIIHSGREQQGFEYDLIWKLFGDFRKDCKFIPGTAHREYRGQIHPAHVKVYSVLEEIGIKGIDKLQIVPELFQPEDIKGNIIAFGSPVVSSLTTGIFQYVRNAKDPDFGFIRKKNPIFELAFDFYVDGENLLQQGAVYMFPFRGIFKKGPNWGIRDNEKEEIILPLTTPDGSLKNDYLLITVLPNIYEQRGLDTSSKIIILGGAHQHGPKAIELLFQNRKMLEELVNRTKHFEYWQALIEVSKIHHSIHTKEDFGYELSEKILIKPVNILENLII